MVLDKKLYATRHGEAYVGCCRIGRGHRVLSGLLVQVGAIYRGHGPGRDSSLEVIIGPRDLNDSRAAQQQPGLII